MLTREANERLTQVGLGTPMGALMRRYWHPIATLPELMTEPVLAVTLLGENLALYRTSGGELGLVAQRCPHRGASLAYGIPEPDGIRCAYHGWKFDGDGTCLEQPAEPGDSTFRDRVHIPAYPAQEMGGLIWAYLGPDPAPLLPRFDLFVRDDLEREIGITRLPCNWLQIMENSLDPVHLEYLYSVYMNYVLKRQGKPPASQTKHHDRIAFDLFEYGIIKRRLWVGDSEDSDEWQVGHPILFPNILSVGEGGRSQFQIRTTERLGTTDKGVIMYRALLEEQMLKVERGEEPMAVVRDPAKNTPMIDIRRERNPFQVSGPDVDVFALRKELATTTR